MFLESQIKTILRGNSILFVGAGFSSTAININSTNPLTAKALADFLFKECELESDGVLNNAVDEYLEKFSDYDLIEILKKEYSISTPQAEHLLITSLPWKRVYTTNYDNLIELSYRQNNKLITPITISDNPKNYKDKTQLCIHLNGFIDRLTPDALKSEFKLTDVSYLTTDFLQSAWVTLFRGDIKNSDCIFFIGFSLTYDLDLKRILYSQPETINKTFFIFRDGESPINIRNANKFGASFAIGIDAFASEITHVKKDYIPEEIENYIFHSFNKIDTYDDLIELKDLDTIELFYQGNVKQEFVQLSISNPETYTYFIKREKLTTIFQSIQEGANNILIHSDLGNGKTIFVHGLSYLLNVNGFNTFIFSKDLENTENEIEHICTNVKKPVIIIENYSNHFDLLKKILLYATDELVLIVTERTFINDTVYLTLEEEIFKDNYITCDLNQLTDSEVDNIVKLFSNYGFWGKFANKSEPEKKRLITKNCNRTIRLLLLEILKSPDIQKRFTNILNTIKNKKSFYNSILLILASNIFDFRLELDDLIYIFDDEILNNPSFSNNPNLKEMIDFDRQTIVVRSSILSESILSNIDNQQPFIDCLIKTVTKLDQRRYDHNIFRIIKSIVSFSRLQRVLNKNAPYYKDVLISFFEQVKNLSCNRNNPYFWLQYAIARLSIRDYPNADIYFNTAYSFADARIGFDTFQIDNHHARFLLENENYYGDQESCMAQFIKAHKILTKPGNNEQRHYPIRVALNYIPFYDTYYKGMKESEKIIFLKSCKEIIYKIEEYNSFTEPYKRRKEVSQCDIGLNKILINEINMLRKIP